VYLCFTPPENRVEALLRHFLRLIMRFRFSYGARQRRAAADIFLKLLAFDFFFYKLLGGQRFCRFF
jgi:hypothetical protein